MCCRRTAAGTSTDDDGGRDAKGADVAARAAKEVWGYCACETRAGYCVLVYDAPVAATFVPWSYFTAVVILLLEVTLLLDKRCKGQCILSWIW